MLPSQLLRRSFSSSTGINLNLTREQIDRIRIMLRIDLAGEVAANRIYEGQKCILGRDPEMAKLLKVLLLIPFISLNEPFQQMHEQEVEHLRTLNELAWQYNARQTIFTPLAHGIAYVLGEIYPYQIY